MIDCVFYPNECKDCRSFGICSVRILRKKEDRKEYHKKRYQEHKEEIKQRYTSQTQYIKWIDVKKTITRLKKQIGTNNYELLMDEFEKLNKEKNV